MRLHITIYPAVWKRSRTPHLDHVVELRLGRWAVEAHVLDVVCHAPHALGQLALADLDAGAQPLWWRGGRVKDANPCRTGFSCSHRHQGGRSLSGHFLGHIKGQEDEQAISPHLSSNARIASLLSPAFAMAICTACLTSSWWKKGTQSARRHLGHDSR